MSSSPIQWSLILYIDQMLQFITLSAVAKLRRNPYLKYTYTDKMLQVIRITVFVTPLVNVPLEVHFVNDNVEGGNLLGYCC